MDVIDHHCLTLVNLRLGLDRCSRVRREPGPGKKDNCCGEEGDEDYHKKKHEQDTKNWAKVKEEPSDGMPSDFEASIM